MRWAALLVLAVTAELSPADFEHDFKTLWEEVQATYAYLDHRATKWADVPRLYQTDLERVSTRREFVELLEKVLEELYDHHAHLTVNTPASPRLVPFGTDLWAQWMDGRAVVTDVRAGSDAAAAGIRPGAIVWSVDGVPIADAVDQRIGRAVPRANSQARDWALRATLAGSRGRARKLELLHNGRAFAAELPAPEQRVNRAASGVETRRLRERFGYVRFNDSLGDSATVGEFDSALERLRDTEGLVIDLRNTASGGNTTVARGILGRFVDRELPYQKHSLPAEERETGVRRSWVELVSPRGPFRYTGPVVVLVNHWTGSMGEGLAIGFDASRRGVVVGTPMAGLLGATYHIKLPRTGFGFNLPAEKLFHVNGTPREVFRPPHQVDVTKERSASEDIVLEKGLAVLEQAVRRK